MALILVIDNEDDLRVGLAEGLRLAGVDMAERGGEGHAAMFTRAPERR